MVASDAKYHLNCLTSLCRREKKINLTHCDEPLDEQIMKGALAFSFGSTTSTKFEVSTLTSLTPESTITTSLFQVFLAKFLPYKQLSCKNFVSH